MLTKDQTGSFVWDQIGEGSVAERLFATFILGRFVFRSFCRWLRSVGEGTGLRGPSSAGRADWAAVGTPQPCSLRRNFFKLTLGKTEGKRGVNGVRTGSRGAQPSVVGVHRRAVIEGGQISGRAGAEEAHHAPLRVQAPS